MYASIPKASAGFKLPGAPRQSKTVNDSAKRFYGSGYNPINELLAVNCSVSTLAFPTVGVIKVFAKRGDNASNSLGHSKLFIGF